MIGAAVKSKLFIRIWLWSLLFGVIFGIGLAVLVGYLTGLFKTQTGGDDMAQGLVFAFLLLGIGNLASYVVALVLGFRYTKRQGQDSRRFLAKAIPVSFLLFLLSSILPPLLLFGSVLAALATTISINKMASGRG